MLKTLKNTGLSILVLSCVPACEEDSAYKTLVEPALERGLEFGYMYRDMEPSNAGIVIYSGSSQDDELPREEIEIRLSSINKGVYPLANRFQFRDIGENTNFSEILIETRSKGSKEESDDDSEKDSDDQVKGSRLKVLDGSISLLDHAPGRGEWSTDGTPLDLSVELTVNRKRFSPTKCKVNAKNSKGKTSLECSCSNSLKETSTCKYSGSPQKAATQDFEALCCDQLGLFKEHDESLKFETRAFFKADLCTSKGRNSAEVRFCQ